MSLSTRVLDLWHNLKAKVEEILSTQIDPSMLPNMTVADLVKLVEEKLASRLGGNSVYVQLLIKYLEPYLAGIVSGLLKLLQPVSAIKGSTGP